VIAEKLAIMLKRAIVSFETKCTS